MYCDPITFRCTAIYKKVLEKPQIHSRKKQYSWKPAHLQLNDRTKFQFISFQ